MEKMCENKLEEITKRTRDEDKIDKKNFDIAEFQKKYLNEMEELQNAFHAFKVKTYDEFRLLKKQKEDLFNKMTYFKQKYEGLLVENQNLQNQIKTMQTNNEILKTFGNTNDVKLIS
jgi:uncharacterized protein (DUF3084 family)